MPFVAINERTRERIDLTKYDEPKIDLMHESFVCPVCNTKMYIRHGFLRRPHFYHYTLEDCIYARYSEGESPEHMAAKEWLLNFIQKKYPRFFPRAEVILEHHVHSAGRIADVAILFPGGYIHAYEIQLANITIESLAQRTYSYLNAGCDITWIVGKNAYKPEIVKWLWQNQGEVPVIDFSETEMPIAQNID